jgi:hypothetical protein
MSAKYAGTRMFAIINGGYEKYPWQNLKIERRRVSEGEKSKWKRDV